MFFILDFKKPYTVLVLACHSFCVYFLVAGDFDSLALFVVVHVMILAGVLISFMFEFKASLLYNNRKVQQFVIYILHSSNISLRPPPSPDLFRRQNSLNSINHPPSPVIARYCYS